MSNEVAKTGDNHTGRNIAVGIGAGAIAAGALVAAGLKLRDIRSINPDNRRRREKRLLGLDVEPHPVPLAERVGIFGYQEDDSERPTDTTLIAALISNAARTFGDKAIAAEDMAKYGDLGFGAVQVGTKALAEQGLIESVPLLSDANVEGWTALPDLFAAEDLPAAEPLLQAIHMVITGQIQR